MRENLFSYIRAEGCCTKCKCVGRKSRANLFAHDRAQHLVLERSESTKVRERSSGSCRERRTREARHADGYHCEERGRSEGTEVDSSSLRLGSVNLKVPELVEGPKSKDLKNIKKALHTECFFLHFLDVAFF